MPPKKKDAGKKGKKSAKKEIVPKPKVEEISDSTKEFYLIQIKDLEDRLNRYQRRCDELEVKQTQYESQYTQMSSDKKEIVDHLKKFLSEKSLEIEDLNDRYLGLQQAKDAEKDNFEKQLQDLRSEFKETQDNLTAENVLLKGKLSSLEEFRIQREDLMAKLDNCEKELIQKDEDNKEEIYKLERKQVVDKDRLKKEMILRVNQVAAEFRKVSNKQMAETTKRTIRENVSINAQLCKMSDKTTELIQENEDLKSKEKEFQIKVDILENEVKEHSKRHVSSQKIVRMLRDKCKEQEDLIAQYDLKMQQFEEIESEYDKFREENAILSSNLQTIQSEYDGKDKECEDYKSKMIDERKLKEKLIKILSDASNSLKILLSKRSSEDADESIYEKIEKRDNVLENLLIILNSSAALGIGPRPSSFFRSKSFDDIDEIERILAQRRSQSPSSMPGSASLKKRDLTQSPLPNIGGTSNAVHYQLGDLGLVPRPQEKIYNNLERMRELSATTRKFGQLRKLATKSIGVQTISIAKAMFFADEVLSNLPESKMPIPPTNRSRQMTTKAY